MLQMPSYSMSQTQLTRIFKKMNILGNFHQFVLSQETLKQIHQIKKKEENL